MLRNDSALIESSQRRKAARAAVKKLAAMPAAGQRRGQPPSPSKVRPRIVSETRRAILKPSGSPSRVAATSGGPTQRQQQGTPLDPNRHGGDLGPKASTVGEQTQHLRLRSEIEPRRPEALSKAKLVPEPARRQAIGNAIRCVKLDSNSSG